MLRTDRIVAVVVIGISLFLFSMTGTFIEEGTGPVISAAFFPRIILITLIGCCALLLLKSKMVPAEFPALSKTLLAAGLIIGYAFLIEPLGYFLATPAFLFLMPLCLGYRAWGWLAALAVGGTVFAYLIFYIVLGVPLPLGVLEGLGGG